MPVELKIDPHWRPGAILTIETERFLLRSLTPDDATPAYISWWNDPEIQAGLNLPPRGWGLERVLKHIRQFDNKKSFHIGIFDKQTQQMIGFFAAFLDLRERVARTNIVIGEKEYWGKHVVQEVRGQMLIFLFGVAGMEKVKGEIKGRNYPSIFNYKSQGFTCEGVLRDEIVSIDGGRTDVFIFGLLREEWEKAIAGAEQGDSHG